MVDAVRTTTLEVLRRRVSRAMGDLVSVQASQTGTPATLIDQINIPTGATDLNRRPMIFTSGTYRGNQVVITNTDQGANTITFSPPQAGNIVSGVSADIFNRNGMGFSPIAIDDAINETIDSAYPLSRTEVSASFVYDSSTGYLTVPITMDRVHNIEVYDAREGVWRKLWPSPYRTYSGWQPDVYNGRISVSADLGRAIDGAQVMVFGEGRHPQLALYSDTTKLDPDWIVPATAYRLCRDGLTRDLDGNRARMLLVFQQEAEAKSTAIRTRRKPGSRRTRS